MIRSNARLTYGQAQRRDVPGEIADDLELAAAYSDDLRTKRFARGALRVVRPELEFEFDGHGGVADAIWQGEPESHALIEELMIIANEAVAGLLSSRGRESLYRVHERPDPQAVQLLLAKLTDLGVPTPPAPDELTPATAAHVVAQASELVTDYVERSGRGREAFPSLVLRALKQARYDPRNLGHMGLASTAYCHFTSPIRRYPDLVVHRALLHELGATDEQAPTDLADLAEHTSEREREAAEIEHIADDICAAWLLERRLFDRGWDEPWDGEIIGVIPSGLFARFGEVFEGYVPARRLPGDYFELNDTGTALTGRRGGRTYRLGDPIEVAVEEIRKAEGKVECVRRDRRGEAPACVDRGRARGARRRPGARIPCLDGAHPRRGPRRLHADRGRQGEAAVRGVHAGVPPPGHAAAADAADQVDDRRLADRRSARRIGSAAFTRRGHLPGRPRVGSENARDRARSSTARAGSAAGRSRSASRFRPTRTPATGSTPSCGCRSTEPGGSSGAGRPSGRTTT